MVCASICSQQDVDSPRNNIRMDKILWENLVIPANKWPDFLDLVSSTSPKSSPRMIQVASKASSICDLASGALIPQYLGHFLTACPNATALFVRRDPTTPIKVKLGNLPSQQLRRLECSPKMFSTLSSGSILSAPVKILSHSIYCSLTHLRLLFDNIWFYDSHQTSMAIDWSSLKELEHLRSLVFSLVTPFMDDRYAIPSEVELCRGYFARSIIPRFPSTLDICVVDIPGRVHLPRPGDDDAAPSHFHRIFQKLGNLCDGSLDQRLIVLIRERHRVEFGTFIREDVLCSRDFRSDDAMTKGHRYDWWSDGIEEGALQAVQARARGMGGLF